MAMLDVKDLNVYYGKIHAIKNISLTVEEGELVSLIGANGAGKTSLLTAIMGQIPSTGQISFEGQAVHGDYKDSGAQDRGTGNGTRTGRQTCISKNFCNGQSAVRRLQP